jgi:hypothetical protein
MSTRTARLEVEGWSNVRYGLVESNLVLFEVMSLGCACDTCLARLEMVKNRLEDSDVTWRMYEAMIPERGFVPSIVLEVETKETPKKLDSFLSNLLSLQISEIAPAMN